MPGTNVPQAGREGNDHMRRKHGSADGDSAEAPVTQRSSNRWFLHCLSFSSGWARARARWCTRTAAATTAGRGGSRSASGTAWPGSCRRRTAAPDNATCEGFFGRLENEFFYYRDWVGVGAGEFMELLDAEMRRHRDERIKRSLGWRSPAEYRRDLGYTA